MTCLCYGLGTALLQLDLQRNNVTPTTPRHTPQQHTQQTIGGTHKDAQRLQCVSMATWLKSLNNDKAAASAAPTCKLQSQPQLLTC
jgi:hypothetical protein